MNILITGTTSGIGLELAKLYNSEGKNLVLLGRKELKQLDNRSFNSQNYCQVDLATSDCADVVLDFLERILSSKSRVFDP